MFGIVIILIAVSALLAALVRTVGRDGYGTTPGPRSHHDAFDPQLQH
jgi:hypothetical protein